MLTAEMARELFRYDAETGQLFRLKGSSRWPAGALVGTNRGDGYLVLRTGGVLYLAHRVAWLWMTGEWPGEVDHKDRDRGNNRWSNLRVVTRTQNILNSGPRVDNTSGFRGVIRHHGTGKPWRAVIKINGRQRRLGSFDDPAEAGRAYLAARDGALPT